jgi:ABC-type transporter lipoprotein component MlaA
MARSIVLDAVATTMMLFLAACATNQKQSSQTTGSVPVGTVSPAPIEEQLRNLEQRPDPLEPFNQSMLTFNHKLDDCLLHPVAQGYARVVPQPVRSSISRFFLNVAVIPRFANALFQGQFNQAGIEVARFGINSTVGVAGFFDPTNT